MVTWHFGEGGKVVVGAVAANDMDDARAMAARWNRDCLPEMRVVIIANGPIPARATRVTGVA